MERFNSVTVTEDLLRCHLAGLVQIAGDSVPPELNRHPDVSAVPVNRLSHFVDLYTHFLRKAGR